MLMAQSAPYRRYRAPQADGQTLVEPPRSSLAAVVERNREHAAQLTYDFQGRSLAELAAGARRSLLERAVAYTSQYRDAAARKVDAAAPFVLSGHQPQLFHAGVWYKNFVLGNLAREVGGVGIHLLIDSDLCRTASIRVPAGSSSQDGSAICAIEEPYIETVPFDVPSAEVPFEERAVLDEGTFATFADRTIAALKPLVRDSMIEDFWSRVRESAGDERNLGLRIARGRHRLEGEWGNDTLELPQSAVCQLPEFMWFIAHLLANLPRFWAAHNDALADYRRAHQLRNRAQPVPDLAENDGWLEAPFWMWTADDPRRRPVFAQQRGEALILTDRAQHTIALSLTADGTAATAAEQLAELASRGVKIRTRALATTLFARLITSDLFIHGIGGAKYDQVTDQIAERFFGFALPVFATASATLRLPIEHSPCEALRPSEVRQRLRELQYHPERFVSPDGEAATRLIAEKRRSLQAPKSPATARERHLAIAAANAGLQPYVEPLRREIESRRDAAEKRTRANAILESREYAFCLFPRESLERLMLGA
jgi:hypothetical protein